MSSENSAMKNEQIGKRDDEKLEFDCTKKTQVPSEILHVRN